MVVTDIVALRDKQEAKARLARNRIHHKIVATNQLMQQQSEENCISDYIRDYMHTMNTSVVTLLYLLVWLLLINHMCL